MFEFTKNNEEKKTFPFCECKNSPVNLPAYIFLFTRTTRLAYSTSSILVFVYVPKKGTRKEKKINILLETYGLFSNVSGSSVTYNIRWYIKSFWIY